MLNREKRCSECLHLQKEEMEYPYVCERCEEKRKGYDSYQWDDNRVIDFVSWYLEVCKLDVDRYSIENRTIIDTFKDGVPATDWHKSMFDKHIDNGLAEVLCD